MILSPGAIEILTAVTNLGDSAMLGAVTLAAATYFLAVRRRREAFAMAAAFIAAAGLIAVLKVAFISCGGGILNIRSPSGHTALSLAVMGMLALILRRIVPPGRRRRLLPPLLFLLALAIALTRILLHAHTIPEVGLGLLAGLTALLVTNRFVLYGAASHPGPEQSRASFLVLAACVTAAMILTYGIHAPAEAEVGHFALWLRTTIPSCNMRRI